MATALAALMSMPVVRLAPDVTPVQPMQRLSDAIGPAGPTLLVKRDDLLSFALGGNKVRKLEALVAEARAGGADTLVTCGGVQSNHARVTAAAGAALGLEVVLVLNGVAPDHPTGNARLDRLFGADVRYVPTRDERASMMETVANDLRVRGRRPFIIPVGGSTATGALGFARAIGEIAAAGVKPDVIVHATSSGGTQAGLIAGCALFGIRARVVGISADAASDEAASDIAALVGEMARRLGASPASVGADRPVDVDDRFVGPGYGVPTPASEEATEIAARREGIVLDPVYTAKAMAGLIARVRAGEFPSGERVLFWHTGGTPGYFV
jgi:L-cysteate sulfo-lyase